METLTNTNKIQLLREMVVFIKDNKTDKETFLNCVENTKTFEKLKNSIKYNYIDFDKFAKQEYIYDNLYYYNYDDYTFTMEGGIELIEDVFYCDYYEEYTRNSTYKVHIYKNEFYYSKRAINSGEFAEYRGEYYDSDALDYYDLRYCEDDEEIHHIEDLYFWESDGCYHLDDEEENSINYVREYHDGEYKEKKFSDNPKFFIGFEIEKEDQDIKESIYIDDFEDEAPLWRKEKDGSLNDISGFELISPTYELNVNEIKNDIEKNHMLLKHINANKSKKCGGHINISEAGKTGKELFNSLKGYTPLFHALYYGRLNVNYSKGKSNEKLLSDNEKYQSIRIHSNRVEYRIISAVPNFSTLIWRAKLMEFILNNQTECTKEAFFKLNTTLLPLIKEAYKTDEEVNKLIDRVIEYTLEYENISLKK